ncbi:Ribosomal RNA small subunit methyltransferase J [Paenibacillus solanacearum]|uniref:Ribosomal RNA small subunit methyltransferase J n=1 Tax=Paenibacillus solanacearum TaxID=2048548 RepID=A0A916NYS1_9BACL|nr:class I SAM-dependent methyltransferase [Paenibacillus solanacearum]CAG7649506.1 Ribosomal RNA small subunit methyltransferase J [Paenibacillus solanacearum]
MFVTTSYDPGEEQTREASNLAQSLGGRYVPRKRMTLAQLRARYGEEDILLITKERIEYHHEQRQPLFFHPSTAAVRVKRLLNGEPDTLLELAGVNPGDAIVDCTAGLGSDSIVFSFAVGSEGRVTALESSPIPAFLLGQGLQAYDSEVPGLNEAMRRIQVVRMDHSDYLRSLPDRSVDVVYFDPMFRKPITESASIRAIRGVADERALTAEAVAEAKRAARKAVVLKEHRDSPEFERLGFDIARRPSTKIAYGVIRC